MDVEKLSLDEFKDLVGRYAVAHPTHALTLASDLPRVVGEAVNAQAPVVRIETPVDEYGEQLDPVILHPITGEEVDVLKVYTAHDLATSGQMDEADVAAKRVPFDDGYGEQFDSVMYVASSDDLPVLLPDGWKGQEGPR